MFRGHQMVRWVSGLTRSAARVHNSGNNYYLTGANYSSRYIFNRLTGSSVTGGGQTASLAYNAYDQFGQLDVAGMRQHDPAYSYQFTYRGNVTTSVTPGGTTTRYVDIGGSVYSTNTNGVTTNAVQSPSNNWAVPSSITTNALSSSMNWNTALNLTQSSGPNGDAAYAGYDNIGRPYSVTSHQSEPMRSAIARWSSRFVAWRSRCRPPGGCRSGPPARCWRRSSRRCSASRSPPR